MALAGLVCFVPARAKKMAVSKREKNGEPVGGENTGEPSPVTELEKRISSRRQMPE